MKTAPSAAMVLLLVGAMYTQPIRVEVQPGAEFRFRSARERPHLRNRRKRDGASVRDLTAEDRKSGTKKESSANAAAGSQIQQSGMTALKACDKASQAGSAR
jgi:hypothetical protein